MVRSQDFANKSSLVPVISQPFCWGFNVLTLNMWGPSYPDLTRSLSWLLMSWLLASPGHQQPWYWLCKLGRSLSFTWGRISITCAISVRRKHRNCKYMFMFLLKKIARKELNTDAPSGICKLRIPWHLDFVNVWNSCGLQNLLEKYFDSFWELLVCYLIKNKIV